MSRQAVIRSLQAYYDDGRFLADLRRRVAIPTESQNPARRPELYQYLEAEIAPALRALDYAVTIYDNPDPAGGPFLIGRRIEDPDALTVLTYGHGDVVRGLDKDWRSGLSPWTITLDGDRIYGRGVVDNKGQHTINIAALAEVIAARGRLGFNSIFFVEMSEEVGSPGIHAFAQAQRAALAADLLIGSDGPRVTIDRPTIYLGSRGAMNLELTLNLREGGHHSGNWGGLLANPGIILAHAIASIVSKTGEILVPELRPKQLPSSIRKALADIAIDGGADGPAIDPWWGEPGLSAAEKVFGWSTFEVLAYITGNPDDAVNAVPPWASAHCQIRFTVDNDPAGFIPALRRHLDANGFAAIQRARGARPPGVAGHPARSRSSGGPMGGRIDPAHDRQGAGAAAVCRRLDAKRCLGRHARHADHMGAAFLRRLLAARPERARARFVDARRPGNDGRPVLGSGGEPAGHPPAVVMSGRISTGLAALVSMLWLQIANAITWMTLPVLAPQIAPLAGVEPSTIGHLTGVMFAGALLPTLVAGAVIPLIGPVRMSQFAATLGAVGLLIAATGNVWALLIAATPHRGRLWARRVRCRAWCWRIIPSRSGADLSSRCARAAFRSEDCWRVLPCRWSRSRLERARR